MSNEQAPRERDIGPLRIVVSTVILLALVAAGYVAFFGLPGGAGEGSTAEAAPATSAEDAPSSTGSLQAPPATAVPVETATATLGELVMRISATGNAEATQLLEVETAATGEIRELPVQEGQLVEAGDLLVALDDTELRLALQRARESWVGAVAKFAEKQAFLREDDPGPADPGSMVQFDEARSNLLGGVISREAFRNIIQDPRFDELFSTISREEVMAAQDGLMRSQADFEEAELQLGRARTLAPFAGQIADIDVVVGQRVGPGTKLLTLVDADPIRVRVEVLESEAGLVRVGRRAQVHFAAYPTETFVGRVESISPLVDPDSKTLEVIVRLPNPERLLKPGMFAQITLDTEIFDDRLLVPSAAVLLRDERPMLFTVENGRSVWVYIRKGLENPEWVEVLEGVEPGDEVIVSGHYSLAHDSAVRVVEPEAAEGEAPSSPGSGDRD